MFDSQTIYELGVPVQEDGQPKADIVDGVWKIQAVVLARSKRRQNPWDKGLKGFKIIRAQFFEGVPELLQAAVDSLERSGQKAEIILITDEAVALGLGWTLPLNN